MKRSPLRTGVYDTAGKPLQIRARVKSVTVFEVKEKGYTEVHKREQFTNELALVYEDGRTLVLGDKKREDDDAERTFADGAA